MTTEQNILEMMQAAEEAPEPGTFNRRAAIHSPDDTVPVSVQIAALESAGYVYVYDVRSGDRSIVNRNMLSTQLDKRDEDRTRIFSTIKPPIEPAVGTYKCLLHEDQPEREHYDAMGLARCKKSNLISEYQVNRHMSVRHHTEWETIQQEQDRAEKDEERVFQRALMDAIAQGIAVPSIAESVICDECSRIFKNSRALRTHIQMGHKENGDASSPD
jgi:hypothetical protein